MKLQVLEPERQKIYDQAVKIVNTEAQKITQYISARYCIDQALFMDKVSGVPSWIRKSRIEDQDSPMFYLSTRIGNYEAHSVKAFSHSQPTYLNKASFEYENVLVKDIKFLPFKLPFTINFILSTKYGESAMVSYFFKCVFLGKNKAKSKDIDLKYKFTLLTKRVEDLTIESEYTKRNNKYDCKCFCN